MIPDSERALETDGPFRSERLAHRVIVRMCSGHECRNPITTHRVKQNIHGIREYCFGEEQKLLTAYGPRTFADVAGTMQPLLTSAGYVESAVKEFGVQDLYRVVLKPVFPSIFHRNNAGRGTPSIEPLEILVCKPFHFRGRDYSN